MSLSSPGSLPGVRLAISVVWSVLLLAACGGSGGDTGPNGPVTIEKAPIGSGDEQEGFTNEMLAEPLRVIITRDGEPVTDVAVTWGTEDGGSLSPSVSTSGDDGTAESEWILGPDRGSQAASASVEDGVGSAVSFSAHAIEPRPPRVITVQVLDNQFLPQSLTVLVGQTVTWSWAAGGNAHSVTPANDLVPSRSGPPVPGPHTYVYTFTTPGVYTYYCEAHGLPAGTGMAGTVTVLRVAP
jgi:plastocyanin